MNPASQQVKRALRLVRILQMLQERPFTVQELAERFDMAPRTIRQDLLDLQCDPVYAPLICRVRREWQLLGDLPETCKTSAA